MAPVLPNLFLIGAPKCGTTSLHRYLAAHPEVSMTFVKEPHVLAQDDWRARLELYSDWYDASAPVRGESSTGYTAFPWAPEVPERMSEAMPDARLVYVVGDPVRRVVAHFHENKAFGWRRHSLQALLDLGDDESNIPLWSSRYATQLERYLRHFPQERVMVLDQSRLRSDRRAVLGEVFRFVEVDDAFWTPRFDAVHNEEAGHRAPNRLGRLVQRRLGKPVAPRLRNAKGRRAALLRAALTVPLAREEPSRDQLERLREVLAPEAERFRGLTGMAFPDWSV